MVLLRLHVRQARSVAHRSAADIKFQLDPAEVPSYPRHVVSLIQEGDQTVA